MDSGKRHADGGFVSILWVLHECDDPTLGEGRFAWKGHASISGETLRLEWRVQRLTWG